jgi:multiple sugar transport system permease protein
MLGSIGADPREWLGDPNLAMLCVIVPAIWAGAGPGSLIYQAALKSVPESQYEAADIDGAGILRKTWNVTLPTIKPLIIINFVGAFIGAFHAMQNIFVMTGGGPARATYTLGMEIFFNAYLFLNFGYATAVAWILGSLLIGFTMYQLRILKDIQFTAAGSVAGVRE